MSAADKVTLVNTVHGADLYAITAADTKRVVDNGKVVDNLYCTVLTCFFTFHTADTAVDALLARYRALFVI